MSQDTYRYTNLHILVVSYQHVQILFGKFYNYLYMQAFMFPVFEMYVMLLLITCERKNLGLHVKFASADQSRSFLSLATPIAYLYKINRCIF